jgi:hypothetical protein
MNGIDWFDGVYEEATDVIAQHGVLINEVRYFIHCEKKNMCCHLNCGKEAAFEINETTREDPDNYTYSCSDHLGDMIGTAEGFPVCKKWTVTALS